VSQGSQIVLAPTKSNVIKLIDAVMQAEAGLNEAAKDLSQF
jgi:hypothetical protein